jgi:hypothetical protein
VSNRILTIPAVTAVILVLPGFSYYVVEFFQVRGSSVHLNERSWQVGDFVAGQSDVT